MGDQAGGLAETQRILATMIPPTLPVDPDWHFPDADPSVHRYTPPCVSASPALSPLHTMYQCYA